MESVMSAISISPALMPVLPAPPSVLLTAEEFFAKYEGQRVELVRGVVKETPMPDLEHGYICSQTSRFMANFAEQHDLGRVMTNDSFVKVRKTPDSVRGADVCFISYERLPKGKIPRGLLDVVPELVVEVRSPSDAWTEVIGKVLDYLAAGVKAVVVFNPVREAVAVYRAEVDEEHFSIEQTLTIPDVLPGFELTVKKFIE
jgi:Uma2 family endonuclease